MAMMDPKSIGAHIRMRRPELNDLELKVVDNIIAKTDFSEQTTIKEIATENRVSEAMIVKIAKKLGFSGFRELRANLALYRQSEVSQLYDEISPDDDMQQLVTKVFRHSILAIEETMAILDTKALLRCVDILLNSHDILLFGIGGSGAIAEDFSHKLLRIGIRTRVFKDSHMMLMSAALCDDLSAVIAISHSGRTVDIIEPLALSRKNGAKTIVLTTYATSPVTQYADVLLSSTAHGSPLLGENAAARIAQLNILDALFVAIAQRNLKRSEENLFRTRAAIKNKRVKNLKE